MEMHLVHYKVILSSSRPSSSSPLPLSLLSFNCFPDSFAFAITGTHNTTLHFALCNVQASLGNINAAVMEGAPDSLAVLGFFFEVKLQLSKTPYSLLDLFGPCWSFLDLFGPFWTFLDLFGITFCQIGETPNPGLTELVSRFPEVSSGGKIKDAPEIPLNSLIHGSDLSLFYRWS